MQHIFRRENARYRNTYTKNCALLAFFPKWIQLIFYLRRSAWFYDYLLEKGHCKFYLTFLHKLKNISFLSACSLMCSCNRLPERCSLSGLSAAGLPEYLLKRFLAFSVKQIFFIIAYAMKHLLHALFSGNGIFWLYWHDVYIVNNPPLQLSVSKLLRLLNLMFRCNIRFVSFLANFDVKT